MKPNNLNTIKDAGFKIHNSYFKEVEDAILTEIDSKNITQNIESPGFKTPKNYFTNFESRALTKPVRKKVIPLFRKKVIITILSSAASILLLINIFLQHSSTSNIELTSEMIEEYLISNNISEYELLNLIEDHNDITENDLKINTLYNEEHLESYLIENAELEDYLEL